MKDLRSSVVKRHLQEEEKTAEQMISCQHGKKTSKAKKTKEASTKKNTPLGSLTKKRAELGNTSAWEHAKKR